MVPRRVRKIKVLACAAVSFLFLVALAGCGRVLAKIERYSPGDPLLPAQVEAGKSVTLTLTFTNTGNRAGTLIPKATVWDSSGMKVAEHVKPPVFLSPGQQHTAAWDHTVLSAGEYTVQFSVWREGNIVLVQMPEQPQRLIVATPALVSGKFSAGDRVRVAQSVNVRTGPGTASPKVSHVNYPGVMAPGSMGKVVSGPQKADGYVWWKVEFDNGVNGWCIEDALTKVSGK